MQESSLADIITEKLNGFKEELLTEIKLLIKSEVTKDKKKDLIQLSRKLRSA